MIQYIADPRPLLRVQLNHLLQQIPCIPRYLIRIWHFPLYNLRLQLLQRSSLKRQKPIEQSVQNDPQGPDIRCKLLVPIPYKNLRSYVLRGATDLVHDLTLEVELLGNPKITDF